MADPHAIKKLIGSMEVKAIIEYIKNNPGATEDKVANDLKAKKVCSRLTTLSALEKLILVGIIKDDRKGKYFHSLFYNENYDFYELAISLLTSSIDEVKNAYNGLSKDDEVEKLFDELEGYVVKFKHKRRPKTGYHASVRVSGEQTIEQMETVLTKTAHTLQRELEKEGRKKKSSTKSPEKSD